MNSKINKINDSDVLYTACLLLSSFSHTPQLHTHAQHSAHNSRGGFLWLISLLI